MNMTTKKYYADKEEGTIEVKFSKAEMGKQGIMAVCDYVVGENGTYEVVMSLGVDYYEGFSPYRTINIDCNYSDLKNKLVEYWKNELESGAANKMIDFIDRVVRPTSIKSIEEVATLYKVTDLKDNVYIAEVYENKTVYYIEKKGKRQYIASFDKRQSEVDICRYVSDIKEFNFEI